MFRGGGGYSAWPPTATVKLGFYGTFKTWSESNRLGGSRWTAACRSGPMTEIFTPSTWATGKKFWGGYFKTGGAG